MFASTLDGIAASVRCVSSMIVILKLNYPVSCGALEQKDGETRKSSTKVPFLLNDDHKHLTSIAVLTVHAETSLLYILCNDLCKLIEI